MRALPLASLLLLFPTWAAAHPGPHTDTGWLHSLTSADHLAALALFAAALGGLRWWQLRRRALRRQSDTVRR